MRLAKCLFAIAMAAVASCPLQASSAIRVVDNRPEEAKKGHRDSNFSAFEFLPDRVIKPGPVQQLQSALDARQPASGGELVIDELSVVDVFLFRAKVASSQSSMLSLLFDKKTDWNFLQANAIPRDVDSVLCVLQGSFDGREVKVSAVVAYKLPLTAVIVRSNAVFREAVSSCIGHLAEKILSPEQAP